MLILFSSLVQITQFESKADFVDKNQIIVLHFPLKQFLEATKGSQQSLLSIQYLVTRLLKESLSNLIIAKV